MKIAARHLRSFGYTESEAQFVYLVATHSGYFVARQFLGFARCHWGERTTSFWHKLQAKKHARTERFPMSGTTYHLFSRRIYRQLDRENLRNRRQHEIEYVQRRLAMLDFVLSHPAQEYLETEPEKVRFFCEVCSVPLEFLPAKLYHGHRGSAPTARYFVDRFPMSIGNESSSPVPVFTYIQGSSASLSEFVHHLEDYLPLFRRLPEFRFLYLSRAAYHFEKAEEIFNSLVSTPLEPHGSADLLRYFRVRKAWDSADYSTLTEADLLFRNQSRERFRGPRFEQFYRDWKAMRIADADVHQKFGNSNNQVAAHFEAEVLPSFGPSPTEGEVRNA
jgi:hypothetical protein